MYPPGRGISGQLDIWLAFGSGWPSVRWTPIEISSDQEQYYIRSPWHLVSLWVRLTCSQKDPPLDTSSVLLSAIDQLEFSRVLYNRLSSFFICNPPMPPTPLNPLSAPWHPTQAQVSSGKEWYYCRSAWHVISLWVRLMFCQMYPPTPSPQYVPQCPQVEAFGGSGTNLGPIDLSSCCIVCNRLSLVFKSTLQ